MSNSRTTHHAPLTTSSAVNVASRLTAHAAIHPERAAVIHALGSRASGKNRKNILTFRELDQDSDRIARGLRERGVSPGTRLALLVRPSVDFVSLVFSLFKAGVVSILIDPGMGRRNLIHCLAEAEPEGFIAGSTVHAVRFMFRRRFPRATVNVTVGRCWLPGTLTLDQLRGGPWSGPELASTTADDPAAIIFTTGSTGPPKGVLYRHGNFDRQVVELQSHYGIQPGEVDLACFPLFGLFNAAMGVTTVIPDMDASRPARANPAKIVAAVQDWKVTQSFGSPALWNRVGQHCREHSVKMGTLRRVFSAGAPIPPSVLETMHQVIADQGYVYTPYGATEALPVASIEAREVLSETRIAWANGRGTCVGKKFAEIEWRVIRIVDGPIASPAEIVDLPRGEIGELIVRGPVVTREYVTRVESNRLAKIIDGQTIWHRMGDVGYFDERERFWFCGRMAHRVETTEGTLFTDPCEGVFNQHPSVFRSALVGIGARGHQTPVMIFEPRTGHWPRNQSQRRQLLAELRELGQRHDTTRGIDHFLLHRSFPVDIRHNAKIFRERLAEWAQIQLTRTTS